MNAVTDSGQWRDISRWYQFESGTQAVLPAACGRRPARVSSAGGLPNNWGTGGIVSDAPLSAREMADVFDDVRRLGFSRFTLWPDATQGADWEAGRAIAPELVVATPRRFHVIDLDSSFETITATRFDKYTRRYVKRARDAGVTTVHASGPDLIEPFMTMLHRIVPRWAAQQHEPVALARLRAAHRDPRSKFEAIMRNLGDSARIGVAFVDCRPVAAALYLIGRNADIIWAPVDPDRGIEVHAPTLLYVEAIEAACAAGCGRFSMGESGMSEGLDRFKRRLGAHSVEYHSYRIEHAAVTRAEDVAKRCVKRIIGFNETRSLAVQPPAP